MRPPACRIDIASYDLLAERLRQTNRLNILIFLILRATSGRRGAGVSSPVCPPRPPADSSEPVGISPGHLGICAGHREVAIAPATPRSGPRDDKLSGHAASRRRRGEFQSRANHIRERERCLSGSGANRSRPLRWRLGTNRVDGSCEPGTPGNCASRRRPPRVTNGCRWRPR